jgi:hypothetical protein
MYRMGIARLARRAAQRVGTQDRKAGAYSRQHHVQRAGHGCRGEESARGT